MIYKLNKNHHYLYTVYFSLSFSHQYVDFELPGMEINNFLFIMVIYL